MHMLRNCQPSGITSKFPCSNKIRAFQNKALQDKLDKEAKALQEKMNEDNEKRAMESKALADRLEREKQALGI